MRRQSLPISITLFSFFASSFVAAETPPQSQETLNEAPIVASGVVTSVSEDQGSPVDCLTHHNVVITINVSASEPTKKVRGYYDEWTCTKGTNGQPPPPQPPGHYETWGIRSIKVGDLVKIYANANGDIIDPNGIELIRSTSAEK
jgi:hypothetical protein